MKDLWSKISSKLYGIITVAGVNCVDNDVLCDEFEAYGCPAIFVAPANIESDYIKYQGQDKLGRIASFAVKHMENFAQIVNEFNYERFIGEQLNKMKVLLFTNKNKTAPLLKALSKEYRKTLVFGEVRKNEKTIIGKYNVTKLPTIMVLTGGSGGEENTGVVYEGPLRKD